MLGSFSCEELIDLVFGMKDEDLIKNMQCYEVSSLKKYLNVKTTIFTVSSLKFHILQIKEETHKTVKPSAKLAAASVYQDNVVVGFLFRSDEDPVAHVHR